MVDANIKQKVDMEKPFIKWILGLFDNNTNGASLRKALAIWLMVLITRLHGKYLNIQIMKDAQDWGFGETLLYADYTMIGLLIGFIVFQDLLKFKFWQKETPSPPESNTQKTETAQ